MDVILFRQVIHSLYVRDIIFTNVKGINKLIGGKTITWSQLQKHRHLKDYISYGLDTTFTKELQYFIDTLKADDKDGIPTMVKFNDFTLTSLVECAIQKNNHQLVRHMILLGDRYGIKINNLHLVDYVRDMEMFDVIFDLLLEEEGKVVPDHLQVVDIRWHIDQHYINKMSPTRLDRIIQYWSTNRWTILTPPNIIKNNNISIINYKNNNIFKQNNEFYKRLLKSDVIGYTGYIKSILYYGHLEDIEMLEFIFDHIKNSSGRFHEEMLEVPLSTYFSQAGICISVPGIECYLKWFSNPGKGIYPELLKHHSDNSTVVDYMMEKIEYFHQLSGGEKWNIDIINHISQTLISKIWHSPHLFCSLKTQIELAITQDKIDVLDYLFSFHPSIHPTLRDAYDVALNTAVIWLKVDIVEHLIHRYSQKYHNLFPRFNDKYQTQYYDVESQQKYTRIMEMIMPLWEVDETMDVMSMATFSFAQVGVLRLVKKLFPPHPDSEIYIGSYVTSYQTTLETIKYLCEEFGVGLSILDNVRDPQIFLYLRDRYVDKTKPYQVKPYHNLEVVKAVYKQICVESNGDQVILSKWIDQRSLLSCTDENIIKFVIDTLPKTIEISCANLLLTRSFQYLQYDLALKLIPYNTKEFAWEVIREQGNYRVDNHKDRDGKEPLFDYIRFIMRIDSTNQLLMEFENKINFNRIYQCVAEHGWINLYHDLNRYFKEKNK